MTHPITAFSFSDSIETDPNADLPLGTEHFFDLEDCGLDNDFDDPVEDDPVQPQPRASPIMLSRKPIKTYLVKYTAYKTLGSESLKSVAH